MISHRCKPAQHDQTYNQLDGVSKGRVHEATNSLTQLDAKLFGSKAQESSKRDNGQEVDNEDGYRVHAQSSKNDTGRHKDE